MAFELRPMGRQKVRRNSDNDDNPLKYQLVVDGGKVTPTSATITIYRNGQSTALVSAAAMTASGSILSYSVDTTTVASWPADSYRAEVIVTYDSKTYDRHFFFDVVPYLFDSNISYDQLVALDDSIRGMTHDGDASFKAFIAACRVVIQAKIEAKVLKDKRLMQEMIIDHSGVAVASRFYMLHRLHQNKRNTDIAESYKEEFDDLLGAILSSIKYDPELSGDESAELGGETELRFVT